MVTAPDPPPQRGPESADPPQPASTEGVPGVHAADKFRIRFRKDGPLRWLSHHDLLRTFERMLRRADLPFHSTQGFNPHPRLVFALSLPLGVVGAEEVAELEMDRILDPAEVRDALARQTPPGLAILDVQRVPVRTTAHVRGLTYGLAIPAERVVGLRERMAEVLAAPNCWVERTRPPRRRLDIRPFLRDLRLLPPHPPTPSPTKGGEGEQDRADLPSPAASGGRGAGGEGGQAEGATGPFLEMDLWLTPAGTARPEEVLGALGLGDLLEAGAVLERTRLELEDPLPPAAGRP